MVANLYLGLGDSRLAAPFDDLVQAKSKASALLCSLQSDQQIGDLLVLFVQLGAVTVAGLADTKGTAGQCNADPA